MLRKIPFILFCNYRATNSLSMIQIPVKKRNVLKRENLKWRYHCIYVNENAIDVEPDLKDEWQQIQDNSWFKVEKQLRIQ